MSSLVYWSSGCQRCPLRAQYITPPSRQRRVKRWKHAAVLDDMQTRLDRQLEMVRGRRRTVQHPFGTLKCWMGATHFLMKTLAHVSTEMSLHVLAYNLKRVMKILGVGEMLQAIRVCARFVVQLASKTASLVAFHESREYGVSLAMRTLHAPVADLLAR